MAVSSRLSFQALIFLALLAGCRPNDPLESKVTAGSPLAFSMWRSQLGTNLTADEWHEFDSSIQEIKYRVTAEYQDTGAIGVDEAMRSKVDGQSVRHVLELGCRAKLARLQSERAELEHFLAINATLRTRPDDTESINYLREVRDRQAAKAKTITEEMELLKTKLRGLRPRAAQSPN